MYISVVVVVVVVRQEIEEERDTLQAKCLRSESCVAELRTQLEHGRNGKCMTCMCERFEGRPPVIAIIISKQIWNENFQPLQKQKRLQFQFQCTPGS